MAVYEKIMIRNFGWHGYNQILLPYRLKAKSPIFRQKTENVKTFWYLGFQVYSLTDHKHMINRSLSAPFANNFDIFSIFSRKISHIALQQVWRQDLMICLSTKKFFPWFGHIQPQNMGFSNRYLLDYVSWRIRSNLTTANCFR